MHSVPHAVSQSPLLSSHSFWCRVVQCKDKIQLNIGDRDMLQAISAYFPPFALALREEKCFTVRRNPSSTDTPGMYPSSRRALLQSSWRFAFAMRMRIGVNSDAAMVCAASILAVEGLDMLCMPYLCQWHWNPT